MKTKLPTVPARKINHLEAGRLVRERRTVAGMSLRRLAKEMGLSPPFISDLELGKRNWTEEHFQKAIAIISGVR